MRQLAVPSLLALAASLTAAAAAPVTFTSAGNTFQSFTAPDTGTYDIVAFGAQGGSVFFTLTHTTFNGGLGAEIGGDFTLTAGETLSIAVGTMGGPSGGGGGGTFVVGPGGLPLVIGGGGGAGVDLPLVVGLDAISIKAGQTGTAGAGGDPSPGGVNGSGGSEIIDSGGGGGGFYSAGGSSRVGGNGGAGYPSLLGGIGNPPSFGDGGFGGGGGSTNGPMYAPGSGGGGGYSGGGGGIIASGGGGSFDAGTNQVLVAGFNSGDGSVVITELSATPLPEPASLALLGAGLAGLLAIRRRRAG